MGNDKDRQEYSDRKREEARRVVVPSELGRVLDANVSGEGFGVRRTGKLATLPCGVQQAFDSDGRYVGSRAPSHFSFASCPRLTLDAAADALDELAKRVSTLERALVAISRKSIDPSDPPHDLVLVCREVRQQAAEGRVAEWDRGSAVGDIDTE